MYARSLQCANLLGRPIECKRGSAESYSQSRPWCRSAEEADAQSLRCAILLDELDVPGKGVADPRMGRILVELKTPNAVRLLNYCCSKRVQALPTSLANARRWGTNAG